MSKRKPINQMSQVEISTWLTDTKTKLQRKMAREQNYLARRAVRGTRTPTDEAYEQDQILEADLLALLDKMESLLPHWMGP